MRRLLSVLGALALVLTACGTAAPEPGATDAPSSPIESDRPEPVAESPDDDPDSSGDGDVDEMPGEADAKIDGLADDDQGTTEDGESEVVLRPDGPLAPNVTLDLDDGSTFVLADAERPVMFVFWAEW